MAALLITATGCGNDDEPDVITEPPVYNLQKSDAVEAVDLGLSVLWSSCNLGANSPTDYGGYFAWGDPTGALWSGEGIGYNENGYTWNTDNYGGKIPPNNIGGTDLDVVAVHWGDGWRMPSYNEMLELATKCHWTILEQGGHSWYEVTGPNGNSIAIPIAGLYTDPTDDKHNRFLGGPAHVNSYAFYWTADVSWKKSSLRGYDINPGVVTSWCVIWGGADGSCAFRDHVRAFHMSIRPVHDK